VPRFVAHYMRYERFENPAAFTIKRWESNEGRLFSLHAKTLDSAGEPRAEDGGSDEGLLQSVNSGTMVERLPMGRLPRST